ncbi:MAG: fasciclin domain-containing protein, partial [Planctomycetota bacterium]
RLMAADLKGGSELTTIDGRTLTISNSEDGDLVVEGARVVNADYDCANGVVHVVDRQFISPKPYVRAA